ncbi:MAG: substrate-binding domain-containing protein [Lacipirellulaceae bacterium]
MNTTRASVWISVVALAVAILSYRAATQQAPAQTKPARVLFLAGGDSSFWQLTAEGAKAAAKQFDVELTVQLPKGGQAEQSERLAAVSAKDFDGVAVSPRAPQDQGPVLRDLAKEVHLLTFDSDAPESDRLCYVGTDNYSAGRLAAQLVKQAAPKGGAVAVLAPDLVKDNASLRIQGFRDEIVRTQPADSEAEAPVYELLGPLEDGIDTDRCRAHIEKTLDEHPDVVAFVGLFSYHGPALLSVLKERKPASSPALITFDEEQAVLDAIEQGKVFATVVQDPFKYGYESVRMLAEISSGHAVEIPIAGGGSLFLPCEAIRSDNVGAFRKRLASRLAK